MNSELFTTITEMQSTYQIVKPIMGDLPQLLWQWRSQQGLHHGKFDRELYRTVNSANDKPFVECVITAIQSQVDNPDDSHFMVAKRGEKILGFIMFQATNYDHFDSNINRYGEVKELYVEGAEQRKGIGTQLISNAREYFRTHGIKHMKITAHSENFGAQKVYAGLGREIERTYLISTE